MTCFACENFQFMSSLPISEIVAGGAFATAGALAWSAFAPSSQVFGPTIRRTGDDATLALTFDDGPNPLVTPKLLDLMYRYDAKASFFLIGGHVRKALAIAKEIKSRGHSIGNHTETHPSLVFLPPRRVQEELDRCDDAIASATGEKPAIMRPPFGFRSPLLDGIIRKRGMKGVVMWSAKAWDWKPQPVERVIHRLRRVRGGDIVLLHDGDHRKSEGERMHVVAALEYWLPRWKDAGLRFVTMDEVIAKS